MILVETVLRGCILDWVAERYRFTFPAAPRCNEQRPAWIFSTLPRKLILCNPKISQLKRKLIFPTTTFEIQHVNFPGVPAAHSPFKQWWFWARTRPQCSSKKSKSFCLIGLPMPPPQQMVLGIAGRGMKFIYKSFQRKWDGWLWCIWYNCFQ